MSHPTSGEPHDGCLTCQLHAATAKRERLLGDALTWPNGYRCAVSVVFNYQGAEGQYPNDRGLIDYEVSTEREYGPKVGIWRCLRVMEEQQIRATFLVCGATAERYPETVLAIRDAGHEIAGHGYHHEVANRLDPDIERGIFTKTMTVLKDLTGESITGWRSCHQSENTPLIAMDLGFKWNSNSFYYDNPYYVLDGERSIVEIPRQPFGDMRTYGFAGFGGPPEDALAMWRKMFETLYRESASTPTYVPLSLHPFITGRPGRSEALAELLAYIKSFDGVWFATSDQVADRVLECAPPARLVGV